MREAYANVVEFVRANEEEIPSAPGLPEGDDLMLLGIVGRQCVAAAETLKTEGTGLYVLRARLMLEELGETLVALSERDLAEVADGLVDLCYVAIGTGVVFGIPLPEVWEEVQRANMAKFPVCAACKGSGRVTDFDRFEATHVSTASDGSHSLAGTAPLVECRSCSGCGRVIVRDEGGKVTKPPGWTPPDVAGVLARYDGGAED